MTHTQIEQLSDLGQDLLQLSQAMAKIGTQLRKLSRAPKVNAVRVTPETDPEMFTPEFIETVRKSREDIAKGRVISFADLRKKLGIS